MDAAWMVRQARRMAGLSQRAAAARAGVPQSTVARIETGVLSPRVETLDRLLEALGFEIDLRPVYGGGIDRSLIRRMLALSPTERVEYAVAGGRASTRLHVAMEKARP